MGTTASSRRSAGLDLLRLLAACGIIMIHVLGQGGALYTDNPTAELVPWFFGALSYGAVDCFALISGYVGQGRRVRFASLASLELQTLLYSVGITAVLQLLSHGRIWLGFRDVFPTLTLRYWYFSAYTALFCLTPFLNRALASLERRPLLLCSLGLVLVLSLADTTSSRDPFALEGGFCTLWLLALYLLGGFLGRFRPLDRLPGWALCLIWLFTLVLGWLIRYFHVEPLEALAAGYTSPFTVLGACCLIALFSRLRLRRCGGTITWLAGSSFALYVIHAHPRFSSWLLAGSLSGILTLSSPEQVGRILLRVGLVAGVCLLIDLPRRLIWRLLRVPERLSRLEERLRGRFIREEVTSGE